MKQYGQTWGLSTMYAGTKLSGKQSRDGGFPIAMPGKGLYKILKVSKDESNCCYDLEVQGFMCEVMKNKTAVRASCRAAAAAAAAAAARAATAFAPL